MPNVKSLCEVCRYALRLSVDDSFISCLKDSDQTEELMDEECTDFELDPDASEDILKRSD